MIAKDFYEQYKGQYLKYIGSAYQQSYDLVPGKLYRVIGYYKMAAYNDSVMIESHGEDASPVPLGSSYIEVLPFIAAPSRCWRIGIKELQPLTKTDKFEMKRRVKTPMGLGKVVSVEDNITCVELDDNPEVLHEFTEDEISTL